MKRLVCCMLCMMLVCGQSGVLAAELNEVVKPAPAGQAESIELESETEPGQLPDEAELMPEFTETRAAAMEEFPAPETGITVETNDTGYAYKPKYDDSTELDFTDPMYLSDEAFFGKYENGGWAVKPKLDYEGTPDLFAVEELAMQGAYDEAKEELLEYYRLREQQYTRTAGSSLAPNISNLHSSLLEHNLHYNSNSNVKLIDCGTVESHEYQLVEVDVTSFVKNVMDTETRLMPFYLMARNKDGAEISILSKEYGDETMGPRLEVYSNGVKTDFGAVDDAYVTAGYGINDDTNYQDATELLLEESMTSVNLKTPKQEGNGKPSTLPADENTKRVHLKFDLEDAGAADAVNSAKLKFYAKINDKENIVNRKDVIVFVTKDNSWNEETVTYNTTSHYIFSYEHEPSLRWHRAWFGAPGHRYTDELYRIIWMKESVSLYKKGEADSEYHAYAALKQWANFIQWQGGSAVAPQIHWCENKTPQIDSYLGVAERSKLFPGYLLNMINSKHMSGDLLTASLKYAILMEEYTMKKTPQSNNIGASEISGLYSIGVYFPELAASKSWRDKATERVTTYIRGYMRSDSSLTEVALGYISYALSGVSGLENASTAMNLEYELDQQTVENLRLMGYYLIYISAPGGRDPQQGDASLFTGGDVKKALNSIVKWTNDPYIEYVATDGQEGKMPPGTSKMYPDGRKYAMRSDWTPSAIYLHTNADAANTSHGHPDDLSIVLTAYGQYLLADPLYSSYQGGDVGSWLKSTKAHNTVVVNDANQATNTSGTSNATMGTTNRWEANGTYDFADITGNSYGGQGVSPTRKILYIRSGYFIVSDYLKPTDHESKNYKQSWHFLPEANLVMDEASGVARTNMAGANIQVAAALDENVKPVLRNDGYYGYGHSSMSDNVKYIYYEQDAQSDQNAVFNTLLYPEEIGKAGKVQVKNEYIPLRGITNNGVSATRITIDDQKDKVLTEGTYCIVHDRNQLSERVVGDYITDAATTYIEHRNGSLDMIAFQEGRKLSDASGAYYIKSNQDIPDLGVSYEENALKLSSSKEVKLEELTVFAPDWVKEVQFNDEKIDYKRSGGYVYFGDEPLLDETAKTPEADKDSSEEEKPQPTPTVPDHSSGGNSGGGSKNGGGQPVLPPVVTPTPTPAPAERLTPEMKEELAGHWAEAEITQLVEDGVVNGLSDGTLGLRKEVTRAEFVSLIVRSMGLEKTSYDGGFEDVSADAWYADDLATAKANGFFSGDGTNANSDQQITRQEMAVILGKLCDSRGISGSAAQTDAFADEGEVSGWAKAGIEQVVSAGLMNGMEDNCFKPLEHALREQAIVVIYRLRQLLK